jgi:hypothetical protein
MSVEGDDPDIGTLDDQIHSIGPEEIVEKQPRRRGPKPKGPPKKRGPKPKNKKTEPERAVHFDDEPTESEVPPEPVDQSSTEQPTEAKVDDSFQARSVLCEKIRSLRKRFSATGSGLDPNPDVHSIHVLAKEVSLLNQEVDCKRGESSIKMLTVQVVAPILMRVVDIWGRTYERQGQPRPLDLTHLDEVVKEDWDVLFADAAAQIAINNPQFFAAGPYAQFGEGLFGACARPNYMNLKARERAAAQQRSSDNQE